MESYSYNSGLKEVTFDEKESMSERGTSLGGDDYHLTESVIDKQMKDFQQDRKNLEDPDQINFNDPIFKRILAEEELKILDQTLPQKCIKCECKFNSITNRKFQCYFCGYPVCKDHSKKKREDPSKLNTSNNKSINNQNNSTILNTSGGETEYEKKNFKKICDICEDKYLKWQINYSFQQKKDQYDDITQRLEKQQKDILEKIKKQQDEISRIQSQEEQKKKQFEEQKNELLKKIEKAEMEDTDLKKENKDYLLKIDKIDTEINNMMKQIKDIDEEYKQKVTEEKNLTQKIKEIDQEIENAHQIIEEIEQKITDNNLMMQRQKQIYDVRDSRLDSNLDNIRENSAIRARKDQNLEREKNCNVCQIF
ncbi:hypothetical protein ABPG74_021481 [Tetrahymena malaccensis]